MALLFNSCDVYGSPKPLDDVQRAAKDDFKSSCIRYPRFLGKYIPEYYW